MSEEDQSQAITGITRDIAKNFISANYSIDLRSLETIPMHSGYREIAEAFIHYVQSANDIDSVSIPSGLREVMAIVLNFLENPDLSNGSIDVHKREACRILRLLTMNSCNFINLKNGSKIFFKNTGMELRSLSSVLEDKNIKLKFSVSDFIESKQENKRTNYDR